MIKLPYQFDKFPCQGDPSCVASLYESLIIQILGCNVNKIVDDCDIRWHLKRINPQQAKLIIYKSCLILLGIELNTSLLY